MTFLELCQAVRLQCGISGSGPAAVTGQTGMEARIVEWVRMAWNNIQDYHPRWTFLWSQSSFTTTDGQSDYDIVTSDNVNELDTDKVTLYETALGVTDKALIEYVPYDKFYELYNLAQVDDTRPYLFTVTPNDKVRLFPTPDDTGYTIDFDFWRIPVELTAGTDTPAIASRYHPVIVYDAMINNGHYLLAPEQVQLATMRKKELMTQLRQEYLPAIQIGSTALGE